MVDPIWCHPPLLHYFCRRSFSSSSSSVAATTTTTTTTVVDEEEDEFPFLLADIGEGIKEVELLMWYVQPGDTVHEFDVVCQVQSDKATVDITSRYQGTITTLGASPGEMIQVGQPLLYFLSSNNNKNHHHNDDAKKHPPANTNRTTTEKDAHNNNNNIPSSTTNTTTTPRSTLADQMAADATIKQDEERLRIPQTLATHYQLQGDNDDDHNNKNKNKIRTSPAVRKIAADHGLDLHILRGTGPQGRILKHDVVQYLQQQEQQQHAPKVLLSSDS
uniref:Lipoamide acyltransferase component of branched-chain alpha-keto acid dehydrogenase complex, mitochondrial n=1 Tax=Amphora coffeiformis TaxID=265554 RepID=A0A7S3L4J1_9STRA